MANIKSAKKRAIQNEKKRLLNASQKSDMRTSIKAFESLLEKKDVEGAKKALAEAFKRIDKLTAKGLIHKNAAARSKSRLTQQLSEAEQSA